jgi:hypothetical protein
VGTELGDWGISRKKDELSSLWLKPDCISSALSFRWGWDVVNHRQDRRCAYSELLAACGGGRLRAFVISLMPTAMTLRS